MKYFVGFYSRRILFLKVTKLIKNFINYKKTIGKI